MKTGNALAKLNVVRRKLIQFAILYLTSAWDYFLMILKVPAAPVIQHDSNRKTIVYLGGNLPPRIARMIKWHKRFEDFDAILICHRDGYREKYMNPSLNRIILFRNQFHLKRILHTLKSVTLIHAFGPKSFYPAIARREISVPFIYDMQDVLVTYYGFDPPVRWYRKELPLEKFVLENCNGFVSHSLEFQEAIRRYGIRPKPRNLFFPLCCDDDVAQTKSGVFNSENIHLVYAGEIAGSFRDSRQFATIQFHSLAEHCARQEMHLHLYPAPGTMQDDMDEYRSIAAANPFLHMHQPVHQAMLAQEFSKYDFGIIPFFFRDTMHDWEKFKYSTSLKLFNYVEAGIPVIATRDIVFQSWIVDRFGMGISIEKKDIARLKNLIKSYNYDFLLENIKKNRPLISLSRHIPRLIRFYNEIIRTHR